MEEIKIELIEKMEQKGLTVEKAAEAIDFNANILGLYLVKDGYPVPKRILDKLAAALQN
jgi:phosphotransacetylase